MAKREFTCINCPMGCALQVEIDPEGRVLSVSGNTCKRGEEYGRREATAPARTVTSTVRVIGGKAPVVSVRTRVDIPKGKIFDCMAVIRETAVRAPVHMGDVLLSNAAGTGVDVIATQEVEPAEGKRNTLLGPRITTVLFDLDGTLLPMDLDTFTNTYFSLLAKKAAEYGYTDAKALVAAVWKGTKAMVANDGAQPNCVRFWEVFSREMGGQALELRPAFDSFYENEFQKARTATGENPLAKRAVDGLKARGYDVILASNPVFPAAGMKTRLSWVGLRMEDFSEVTSYEGYSFCKPNPAYFGEILKKTGKRPEECLMVGNDAGEDLAAMEYGLNVYLVTDCLINKAGRDISAIPHGSFAELLRGLEA